MGLLLVTGCLSVLISLFGFLALSCGRQCLLTTYTVILVMVFLLETLVGLMSYLYQEQMEQDLNKELASTFIDQYQQYKTGVDAIQQQFHCCGVDDFTEWATSRWAAQNPGLRVPDSCCVLSASAWAPGPPPGNTTPSY